MLLTFSGSFGTLPGGCLENGSVNRQPVLDATHRERASLPYFSLSERVRDLEHELDRIAPEDLQGKIYDQLYRLHFGRRSFRRNDNMRHNTALGRAYRWCLENEVDFATFVAANMTLLGDRCGRYGFQPNMLSGENAIRRYNGYVARANRRYRRGNRDAFGGKTWIGLIRQRATATETEIGDLFVHTNLSGGSLTWEDACDLVERSEEWSDLQQRRGAYLRIADLYGKYRADRERTLVTWKAVWNVAQGLRHGLPDHFGFTEMTWSFFLDFARSHLPDAPAAASFDMPFAGIIDWRSRLG